MADRAPDRSDAALVLDLRIEELVLYGFERVDRHQVASAIERELARLLHDPAAHDRLGRRGASGGSAGADRLDGGRVHRPARCDRAGGRPCRSRRRSGAAWRRADRAAADAPRGRGRTQLPGAGAANER